MGIRGKAYREVSKMDAVRESTASLIKDLLDMEATNDLSVNQMNDLKEMISNMRSMVTNIKKEYVFYNSEGAEI